MQTREQPGRASKPASPGETARMTSAWLLQKSMFLVVAGGLLFPNLAAVAATLKPVVSGKRGVVAAGHPLVAEAGLRVLEKGGEAGGAGVAPGFAASGVGMERLCSGGGRSIF